MKKRIIIGTLVVALCAYIFADAWDVAPGPLTTKPLLEEPRDYPQVAAVQPEAPALEHPATAPAPAASEVQSAIDSFAADTRLAGRVAVIVQDAETGDVLGERDPNRPALPASNMKIVTAAAALTEFGPDHVLTTNVVLDGTTLYLVGGGDVLLGAGVSDPYATVGRAGLEDLAADAAAALDTAGISTVELRVDSSLFEGPIYHADVEGPTQQFIMEMRPIAIDEGHDEAGHHQANPDLAAASTFASLLADHGISVGSPARAAAPTSSEPVASIESAPMRDLVDKMLVESDNTLADALGHLVAVNRGEPATFAGAARAIADVLVESGYPLDGVTLADASGLSISNRLPASLLARILADTWTCTDCPLASIPAGLPVAGLDGTLTNRFEGSELRGHVRAKTGTLTAANALSGYLMTDAGRPLIFVILADDLEPGTSPGLRAAIDDFLSEVATL